jgi:hypothetical protein
MERFALLYSDGSIGILNDAKSLDDALEEAKIADANEDEINHLTKVARVRVDVVEIVFDPTISAAHARTSQGRGKCKTCGRVG